MLPMLGCAIVQVPADGNRVFFQDAAAFQNTASLLQNTASPCSCSDPSLADGDGRGDIPECYPLMDDLRPVRPELVPARVKDAGFQLYARACDFKDRFRARHAVSCEGWKTWYQSKVKPPKEPPWPKFHPVPAAPAFTPREDEVESIELPQS